MQMTPIELILKVINMIKLAISMCVVTLLVLASYPCQAATAPAAKLVIV